MASDRYTHRSSSQREERRVPNRSANHPPPQQKRRRPREQYSQPPPQQMERESFLSRAKRKAGFWLAAIAGILVIFVLVAMVYGTADSMGLINADMWMVNFGMVCGLVGSWWLYGQFLKKKFGHPSIFQ